MPGTPCSIFQYHGFRAWGRLVCRSGLRSIRSWRHGNDRVIPFLVVQIFHSENHLVFVHTELSLFPDKQQDRMFRVSGADSIDHVVGLQYVFLAKHLVSLFVGRVGAEQFAGKALAAVLVQAARHRVPKQSAAMFHRPRLSLRCRSLRAHHRRRSPHRSS